MIDVRAQRYLERQNLVLKHIYGRAIQNLASIETPDVIENLAQARAVLLTEDPRLRGVFNASKADWRSASLKFIQTIPDERKQVFWNKLEMDNIALCKATNTWSPSVHFLTYAKDDKSIDVVTLQTLADWEEGKIPSLQFSTEDVSAAARIKLSHSTGARYEGPEIPLLKPLKQSPVVVTNLKLEDGVDYHLYCYSESIVCRGKSVYLGHGQSRPQLGSWRHERT